MEHKRPAKYHTRQGQSILDYMQSMSDSHVTINQVTRYFDGLNETIGQTTIYRHLEKLTADGKIRKYTLPNGKGACYQYISSDQCREHLHLKCEICGTLIHAEGDLLSEIDQQLLTNHDFQINMLKTVFYGTCKKCLSGV
ncbi:MAG: transcriptional repressor [Spirochaetaceae bacterium]|jgi:Fur family ferric uptake transcriptional regulator|nr:transcriptional repressor [Spirochaetaceae bacterium]